MAETFHGHKIISDQVGAGELGVVWRELERILNAGVIGDIVEFGCYAGTTSLFIRRLLDQTGEGVKRTFHAYDSFDGLPEKSIQDASPAGTQFKAGELKVSKKDFLKAFQQANLKPPVVHKGWFSDLTGRDVPEQIAFAFLDGDFYDSIMDSLQLVWPCMTKDSLLLIDDAGREALPGVDRAIRDFFADKPSAVLRIEHNIAIIQV